MRKSWAFMTEHMPRVVAMLKQHRERGEGAHLDECWKHGVVDGEPGWFFAAEGGVHVGTLWPEAMQTVIDLRAQAEALVRGGQVVGLPAGSDFKVVQAPLLILRPLEVRDGKE